MASEHNNRALPIWMLAPAARQALIEQVVGALPAGTEDGSARAAFYQLLERTGRRPGRGPMPARPRAGRPPS